MTNDELTKKRDDLTHLLNDGLERKLYGYLKYCGHSGQNAKDAVQDALLWCLTGPEDLNEIRNGVTYFGRKACWRIRDQLRRYRRETALEEAPLQKEAPFLFRGDVYFALSQLNEEDRWLIEEHFLEGASYGELEKLTGISRDNLHARVRRILRRMRKYLERTVDSATGPNDIGANVASPRKAAQCEVEKSTRQKSSTMSA